MLEGTDPDSFYHLKMPLLMIQHGIIVNFPWLPLTIFKDHYVDQHFLYHVILVPFVFTWGPILGGKIAQALLASLVIVVFYWLLREQKIPGGGGRDVGVPVQRNSPFRQTAEGITVHLDGISRAGGGDKGNRRIIRAAQRNEVITLTHNRKRIYGVAGIDAQ